MRRSVARIRIAKNGSPLQAGEGLFCGVVAAHAMDPCARRRGRGADIDFSVGSVVVAPGWAEEELAEVDGAARDVAADKVCVHIFEGAWRKNPASENAIAKAGGETFDLGFEHWQHVYRGAIGHVTVGPSNVFPRGSASGIEEARLREENERALGMTAVAHVVFRCGDFLEGAAEMHGGGAVTVR